MIVNNLDLDIAVAEGVISRAQALQLRDLTVRDLAGSETPIDFSQGTRDEPFRLLRGFRDVFIALGVLIFAIGLSIFATGLIGRMGNIMKNWALIGESSLWAVVVALVLCVFGLILAEIVTRKQRLPLSSLVVSIVFAFWFALLFGVTTAQLTLAIAPRTPHALILANSIVAWAAIAGAIIGVGFYYWRYRLPFALVLLAASLIGLSVLLIVEVIGPGWFENYGRILTGLWGVAVFAAAMWFDIKDRHRVTRFSECAFWLHLFAAPLLIQSLLFGEFKDTPDVGYVLGTMAVMSAVALLIDRRALLVSGLGYFAIAISQLVSKSTLLGDQTFAVTAFVLGGALLTLGLGWTGIRRQLLSVLPFEALKNVLPPAAA